MQEDHAFVEPFGIARVGCAVRRFEPVAEGFRRLPLGPMLLNLAGEGEEILERGGVETLGLLGTDVGPEMDPGVLQVGLTLDNGLLAPVDLVAEAGQAAALEPQGG